MNGPDHRASLNPEELKELVRKVRYVESAMGDGVKVPATSELETKLRMQKKIMIKMDLKRDTIITEHMLTAKRATNGISAIRAFELVGKKVKHDIKKGSFIELSDIDE